MSFKIPNVVNRGSVRWIVLAVFLVGTIFGAAGIAAAEHGGEGLHFYNETVPITDDTTGIETTINGTDGRDAYVNYYRIADDSASTKTLVSENVNLSSPTGETTNTTYEVETNNTAAYHVLVHGGDSTLMDVGNVTVTPLSSESGAVDSGNDSLVGGPVGFGGDSGNGTIIGILAVVALALVVRMKA
jgi:hypothetical protein